MTPKSTRDSSQNRQGINQSSHQALLFKTVPHLAKVGCDLLGRQGMKLRLKRSWGVLGGATKRPQRDAWLCAPAAEDQGQGAEVMSLAADTDLRLERVAGFKRHSQLHHELLVTGSVTQYTHQVGQISILL